VVAEAAAELKMVLFKLAAVQVVLVLLFLN
jgi:hypothetical protein